MHQGDVHTDGDERYSITRRTILRATAVAGSLTAGVAAFAGSAAAWQRFDVDFKGCSEVWLIVGDDDLDYDSYGRDEPLFVNVVIETNGGVECVKVEFTEETATTIPGQYGDSPLVKFSVGDDEKILAVVKYNHNDNAICYVENEHRCANTPNVADWREADCYADLTVLDESRFNHPCEEKQYVKDDSDRADDEDAGDDDPDDRGSDDSENSDDDGESDRNDSRGNDDNRGSGDGKGRGGDGNRGRSNGNGNRNGGSNGNRNGGNHGNGNGN